MKMKLILLALVMLGFGTVQASAQHYRYARPYRHYHRPHTSVSVVYYPATYRPVHYYHRHYRPRYYGNHHAYRYRHMPPGQSKKYYGYRSGNRYAHGRNKYRD